MWGCGAGGTGGGGWRRAGRQAGGQGGRRRPPGAFRRSLPRRYHGFAALRPGLVPPARLGRARPRALRRVGAGRAGAGRGAGGGPARAAPLQRRDAAARRRRRPALRHVLRPVVGIGAPGGQARHGTARLGLALRGISQPASSPVDVAPGGGRAGSAWRGGRGVALSAFRGARGGTRGKWRLQRAGPGRGGGEAWCESRHPK